MNTFHDSFKALVDLHHHFVCQGIYSNYPYSIYKAKYENRIGESPWRSWCYLICIITRGLWSYNARLFNDDITAIDITCWRRREFPSYTRLHIGRMMYHSLQEPRLFSRNHGLLIIFGIHFRDYTSFCIMAQQTVRAIVVCGTCMWVWVPTLLFPSKHAFICGNIWANVDLLSQPHYPHFDIRVN